MKLSLTLLLVSVSAAAQQDVLQQPHITPPKHSVFRELSWGDVNFLHTTDTHGWYAGHLNQKQYSGDWGDFVSFTSRLREKALVKGVDLIVVDTGDKQDGNGLSDATTPSGDISSGIFNQMDYDLVTLGNHELYTEESSIQEYEGAVQHFGEKYVSTNVEYLLENGTWVPFGNKYRYFVTPNQKSRVLALSFLFNFRRANSRTRVTPAVEIVHQDWFADILAAFPEEELDYIVIYGHIPVTDLDEEELLRLHIFLRNYYPNIIIQYLGGHSHIRDFVIHDHKSSALQSGRYCETVGWVGVNHTTSSKNPQFNRKYIDFNRESFKHHLGDQDDSAFDTPLGLDITSYITDMRDDLNLTHSYGYVDKSYMANRYPYGHPLSIYTLLNSTILPTLVGDDQHEQQYPKNRLILVNSGSIRYDLYKGNFTKDTEFIVSPFQNNWNVITLPKSLALLIAPFLNSGGFILTKALASPEKHSFIAKQEKLQQMSVLAGDMTGVKRCPIIHERGLKYGLTTHDDAGCDGDDVIHNSLPYYPSPNIIDSYSEVDAADDQVDVVFYDFIQPYIMEAIRKLTENSCEHNDNDVRRHGGESTGALLRKYFTSSSAGP